MSDNSKLELIREAANRPPYKQDVYANAGQLLAEIEREYVTERTCKDSYKGKCTGVFRCSNCGDSFLYPKKLNGKHVRPKYCTNCGARVVG